MGTGNTWLSSWSQTDIAISTPSDFASIQIFCQYSISPVLCPVETRRCDNLDYQASICLPDRFYCLSSPQDDGLDYS